jgi:hypothetical protein
MNFFVERELNLNSSRNKNKYIGAQKQVLTGGGKIL